MDTSILTMNIKDVFTKKNNLPDISEDKIYCLDKYDSEWSSYINGIKKISKKCRDIPFDAKILAISDTHGTVSSNRWLLDSLKSYTSTEFDIVAFLGDIPTDDLRILLNFVSGKIILGVLGNHDTYETFGDLPIKNIHSEMVVTDQNMWVAGLQGSIKYKQDESSPMLTHKESIQATSDFWPADILFTHDTCYNSNPNNTDYCHKGLVGISEYIYRNRVPLHIHGHNHQRTIETLSNGTTSIGVYGGTIIKISNGHITCKNIENCK